MEKGTIAQKKICETQCLKGMTGKIKLKTALSNRSRN